MEPVSTQTSTSTEELGDRKGTCATPAHVSEQKIKQATKEHEH